MTNANRNYWGWGRADFAFPTEIRERFKMMLQGLLQIKSFEQVQPKNVDELQLRNPRFSLPSPLASICSHSNFDRASHSYGKAFRDVWRGLQGQFPNPPDYVAFPKSEDDIIQLMQFASTEGI
ncbi:MAG: FAD-binding oxidoreductase, partial [Bacteroidota bacterium]